MNPIAYPPPAAMHPERRWLALTVLCLGVLMIALDTTIVNVALPAIKMDLKFNDLELAWAVNAYLLTYGGFLLLGGRLGDLYGHRRLFLIGVVAFTLASLACGLATSQMALVMARAAQGLGGAIVAAVALSLITDLFTEPQDRAKAMGVYGFVCAGGGSLGAMLGGVLTSSLNWHWVFLVNLPIGIGVIAASLRVLPAALGTVSARHLDVWGAVTVTAALILAVYAIANGNDVGWLGWRTLGQLGMALVLLRTFFWLQAREPDHGDVLAGPVRQVGDALGYSLSPGIRPCLGGMRHAACCCSRMRRSTHTSCATSCPV